MNFIRSLAHRNILFIGEKGTHRSNHVLSRTAQYSCLVDLQLNYLIILYNPELSSHKRTLCIQIQTAQLLFCRSLDANKDDLYYAGK